jgi:hypothetical protein
MMTRREADTLMAELGKVWGFKAGLDADGRASYAVETASISFFYQPSTEDLECRALVYRFRAEPRPGLVEGYAAEEQAGTDCGGGHVEYQPSNKGLFLLRAYQEAPQVTVFSAELTKLMKASLKWVDEVVPRVAQHVLHPQ